MKLYEGMLLRRHDVTLEISKIYTNKFGTKICILKDGVKIAEVVIHELLQTKKYEHVLSRKEKILVALKS